MSEAMNQIDRLNHEAKGCNDPERLRKIAGWLRELGQWVDARIAENKAYDIEKRQAVEA